MSKRTKAIIQSEIDKIEAQLKNPSDRIKLFIPKLEKKLDDLKAELGTAPDKKPKVFKTTPPKKAAKKEKKSIVKTSLGASKKEKPAKPAGKPKYKVGDKIIDKETGKKDKITEIGAWDAEAKEYRILWGTNGVGHESDVKKDTSKPTMQHERAIARSKKTAAKKATNDDELEDTVTIQGVTISKADCPDGYEAFMEAKAAKKKSAEASEKKPDIEKASHSLEVGFERIFDSIAKNKIEGEPKAVKKALAGFKADMAKAFNKLAPVLPKGKLAELHKALNTITDIIAEIGD